ncbi:MAG: hypothetical protein D6681_04190 [Calditrichaeota bacterium]|nr:MAG: hypothetical protein D6681_04190 [Calditrichota bacterium]
MVLSHAAFPASILSSGPLLFSFIMEKGRSRYRPYVQFRFILSISTMSDFRTNRRGRCNRGEVFKARGFGNFFHQFSVFALTLPLPSRRGGGTLPFPLPQLREREGEGRGGDG